MVRVVIRMIMMMVMMMMIGRMVFMVKLVCVLTELLGGEGW